MADQMDPMEAIKQLMDEGVPTQEEALDLTQRVNADGTITELSEPGLTAGEERTVSAFQKLKEAVGASETDGDDIGVMVKSWLDENLADIVAPIVEKVVREEIERLSNRG